MKSEDIVYERKIQPEDVLLPLVHHGRLQLLEPLAGNLVADHWRWHFLLILLLLFILFPSFLFLFLISVNTSHPHTRVGGLWQLYEIC